MAPARDRPFDQRRRSLGRSSRPVDFVFYPFVFFDSGRKRTKNNNRVTRVHSFPVVRRRRVVDPNESIIEFVQRVEAARGN